MAISCLSEQIGTEDEFLNNNTITFTANSGQMITKSGIQYTDFEEGNKYLLFGLESAGSTGYDWSGAVMYDTRGVETAEHLINYGEDLFFNNRSMDFYGATICMTGDGEDAYPTNISSGEAPVISLEVKENGLEDLMYSKNLKGCTAQDGVLEMNFTHALSKVQIEVSKHGDSEGLNEAKIKRLAIVNTSLSGKLDIVSGKWQYEDTDAEREFFNGEVTVTQDPAKIKTLDGNDAEMMIFPNEDPGHALSLSIELSTRAGGDKTIVYPLYTPDTENPEGDMKPFAFQQNKKYVLSIILLDDGVRVLVVTPQAYDWIDVPLDTYLGQPVIFGGLMWMDRNLGATNWDCENDWANTRGFYYQHGRNIPYIFDQEKYLNRNKSVKNEFRTQTGKTGQLDIGYEYFFTYNEKGERVYGAVQGGTQTYHYMYHVDTLNVDGVRMGWEDYGSGWEWKGSTLTNYRQAAVPHYASSNGKFLYQEFWLVDQAGYNGIGSEAWTPSNGSPQWRGPSVTTSNIAINPGDPGIYHFIFDARYYHDYLQSGAWCVMDCDAMDWEHWQAMTMDEWNQNYPYWSSGTSYPTYQGWLLDGCVETRTEDTEKVNYYWADRYGNPLPDNHPCPKGWRIPTKEDYAGVMPDHNIENSWAKSENTMYVLQETYGDVLSTHREAAIYGMDHLGRKVIYLIKRMGEDQCYRLRLMWKDSNLTRNAYYGLTTATSDAPMQYLEISRYPGDSGMSFDKYFSASVGSEVITNEGGTSSTEGSVVTKTVRKMTGDELNNLGFYGDFDWESSTETMQIPICGFIYTTMGVDGMYGDGDMTILRCTDWSQNYDVAYKVGTLGLSYSEGAYPYNEAMNWCCYVRTDRNTGLFSGSRKSLGDQIRCVRDVNAE